MEQKAKERKEREEKEQEEAERLIEEKEKEEREEEKEERERNCVPCVNDAWLCERGASPCGDDAWRTYNDGFRATSAQTNDANSTCAHGASRVVYDDAPCVCDGRACEDACALCVDDNGVHNVHVPPS